jgi:glycine dehydrogenase
MAGMRVVVVACDANGNVDVADLRAKAAQHADELAAIMVTYPSTHGVFEDRHRARSATSCTSTAARCTSTAPTSTPWSACARPGQFGGDVSHLNLHKTFCIPHGGGGPGVGPVASRRTSRRSCLATDRWASRGPAHRRRLGRALRQRQHPADLLDLHHADGRETACAKATRWRSSTPTTSHAASRRTTRCSIRRRERPGRARVHPRPAPAQGDRHQRRRRGQAPHRLRLPRADDVLPGGRHADDRADRERVEGRARPLRSTP